jgi:hypothetical protein
MATTYKVLAQSAPLATTNTDVYTVGAGKSNNSFLLSQSVTVQHLLLLTASL